MYIAEDLLFAIFFKLPIKTLIRLELVCKSWNRLICSPSFINFNLKSATRKSMKLQKYYFFNFHIFSIHDGATGAHVTSLSLEGIHHRFTHIVGALTGIVCIASVESRIAILWNPLIRKYLTVPIGDWKSGDTFLVFGFCSSNNDFKLVRIDLVQVSLNQKQLSPNYEVFSVKDERWRKGVIDNVNVVTQFCYPAWTQRTFRQNSCFENGKLHWGSGLGYQVLVFDCERDEFSIMELPNTFELQSFSDLLMPRVFEGLCLLDLKDRVFSSLKNSDSCIMQGQFSM